MEEYENRLTNSLVTWGFGLILGILFGLVVLGWWLWPVQWVDASPEDLLYQYQVDYLTTVIEAYGYTGDAATAQARYFALGENAETAMAQIVQNPGDLSPLLLAQFSEQVAGVPVETLAGEPVEVPDTTTGLNPWIAILAALLFIALAAGVTYLIFRGKERQEAEIEYIDYESEVIDQPGSSAEMEPEPQVIETVYEQPEEEPYTQVESGQEPSDEWHAVQGEEETIETGATSKDLDLPPFIAAAGAGVVAGIASTESGESEPVTEEQFEEVQVEETQIEEGEQAEEASGSDLAAGAAMAGLATAWLAEADDEGEAEPELMEATEEAEEISEEVVEEEEEIEPPEFDELEEEEGEEELGEGLAVGSVEESPEEAPEEFEADSEPPGEELVKPHDPIEVKMRKKLEYVEGIGTVYAQKLAEAGIHTTGKLMVEGVTRTGRQELAERTGISEHLILKWLNQIDLYRIKGIGSEFADLLEAAGVDTVPELAQRNPENLFQALVNTNQEKHLVRKVPSEDQVREWVEQAKQLPRIIQY